MTWTDAMTESISVFFHELGPRGREPLLAQARGTIRFDLVDGKRTNRWLVSLDRGDVSVSHKNAAADCIVRTESTVFEAILSGDANGMAAFLRGELTIEGNPELLVLIQRVFPAPAVRRARRPSKAAGGERR
jgi:putative sterol carrier protein